MPQIETKIASIEHTSAPEASKPQAEHGVTGTSVVRRRKQSLDLLGVTPAQMREFNIPHNKDSGEATVGLRWVRNKDCNVYKDAPEDRVASLQYELDGAEPVRVNSKVVTRHDVMLMQYPKEYDEQAQQAIDAEAGRISEGLRPGAEGAMESHLDFGPDGEPIREMTKSEMKAHLARMHDYHMNSGMIGPTAHMSLADAIRHMGGPEAVARDEDRFRQGSVHREISQEEFTSMMTGETPTKKYFGSTGIGDPTPKTIQQKRDATGRRAAAIAAPASRK